jgi:hypothetical protein
MGKLKRAYWTRITLSGTGRRPKKGNTSNREKGRNSSGEDDVTTSS